MIPFSMGLLVIMFVGSRMFYAFAAWGSFLHAAAPIVGKQEHAIQYY